MYSPLIELWFRRSTYTIESTTDNIIITKFQNIFSNDDN